MFMTPSLKYDNFKSINLSFLHNNFQIFSILWKTPGAITSNFASYSVNYMQNIQDCICIQSVLWCCNNYGPHFYWLIIFNF